MIEHHRHHFNEIIAKQEAERRLAAHHKREAMMSFIIAIAMGAALFVLAALCVALISTPR